MRTPHWFPFSSFHPVASVTLALGLSLSMCGAADSATQTILVEAEGFANHGGWIVDQQAMDVMGSPYLLAHGLGTPVADATTKIKVAASGKYRVWVRTRDWVAPWKASGAPGRFQLLVNGKPLKTTFGTEGASWHWQDGGSINLAAGKLKLALHDLTGFDGRCDAIVFSSDANFYPPNSDPAMAEFRRKMLGLPDEPEDVGEFDLVVVGGGMPGCCAAVSAARLGCRVALIQDRPVLGGNNSSEVRVGLSGLIHQQPYPRLGDLVDEIGPVGHWPLYEAKRDPESARSKQILSVIEQHPEKKIHNAGPASNYEDDRKRRVVEAEKNVRLFLNTHVVRAENKNGRIAAVIGKNITSSRELRFRGRLFADCTGDGTLGFLAGADFRVGREAQSETGESRAPEKADQLVMGTSVQWHSVEEPQPVSFPDCPWAVQFNSETCQKLNKGDIDTETGLSRIRGDWDWETGMNLDQVTEIERIRDYALRVTFGNWAFLKNHSDAKAKVANHRLAWVACIGGKRESRRLLGDVVLQEQDIVGQRSFPDACVTTTWSIDLHYPHPENTRLFPGEEFRSIARHTKVKPYPIPFRCLYSRNVSNLMMAGRDISVTHVALGTIRVMRTGGMMGEVLGMAASLCKQHDTLPRGVYEKHLEELKSMMQRGVGRNAISPPRPALDSKNPVIPLIRRAGNANSDEERLAFLKQARQLPNLDARLGDDLDKLIAEVDSYAHDKKLDYFASRFKKSLDYDFGLASDSPLQPIAAFYRGRMLTWITLESGGFWNNQQQRRALLDKARQCFEQAAKAFPDNRIAAMYLGKSFPAPKQYTAPANAPAWAIHQREAIERLADIIEWWIDCRTQPDGQYGGGWGDDCEMWRWWVPVLIGFDGPKITQAQARFSKALLDLPHMQNGYSRILTDVEHSAEDLADTLTPMMHLDPDNPSWRDRVLRLAELMETLWTGRNERGLLQFKSTYFTSDRVDPKPQRACDTVYHPRAVQPALLYWQRTGDARLTRLFSAWMDTWVDAAARVERGKPAGIIPTAIHWPDGRIGGLGPDWWDPQNHSEYTLYSFPSAMNMMTHTLLLTWRMAGNSNYLSPIRSMAAARLKYLRSPTKEAAPGSEAWCASRVNLSSVLAKYKFLTGDPEFDPLLAAEGGATTLKRDALTTSLRETAGAMAVNFEGYTSEVRYTDRVLRFPTLFGKNGMFEKPIPSFHKPDTELLYRTVTGDPGDALYFPLNAVRWLTPPRDLAALVTTSSTDRFAAELFHFGKTPRAMSAELYLLKSGEYRFNLITPGADKALASGTFAVKGPRARISFDLPPQTPCQLSIHCQSK